MVIDEGYFIKYLKNELTEEETRKLVAWVKEKRENSDFLFSLKEAYTYLNYEKDRKEADTEREWHRFVKQEGLGAETDKRHHFRWTRWLSYAAIALLCLAVGWQLNRFYTDDAADVRCAARGHTEHDAWLKTDPQNPKSIWWYSDVKGIGFRVVCEVPEGVEAR